MNDFETNSTEPTILSMKVEQKARDTPVAAAQGDDTLTRAAGQGDRDAFAALYDRHVRTIYRFALSLGLSLSDAEDVTQDVFIVAFEKARSIRLVSGSALPWLFVTCRNLTLAFHRKAARERSRRVELDVDLPSSLASPEVEAQRRALAETLESAIAELSFDDQCLFNLCIEHGYSYAQAARAINVSHGTVRNRLSRLRANLRSTLPDPKELNS